MTRGDTHEHENKKVFSYHTKALPNKYYTLCAIKNSRRYKSSSVKTHRHPCKSWNSRKKCGIGKWQIAKHFDQTFFTFDDMACLSGVWEHYRSLHGVREGKGLELELKLKTNSCLNPCIARSWVWADVLYQLWMRACTNYWGTWQCKSEGNRYSTPSPFSC